MTTNDDDDNLLPPDDACAMSICDLETRNRKNKTSLILVAPQHQKEIQSWLISIRGKAQSATASPLKS